MNLEVPHQVSVPRQNLSVCESKIRSNGTSQSVKKRGPTTSTRYIILYAGTQNGFVSVEGLIFVSGTKSGNYHDLMKGEF
jgi:hypothetical protein